MSIKIDAINITIFDIPIDNREDNENYVVGTASFDSGGIRHGAILLAVKLNHEKETCSWGVGHPVIQNEIFNKMGHETYGKTIPYEAIEEKDRLLINKKILKKAKEAFCAKHRDLFKDFTR
jgi:hypothetical protein